MEDESMETELSKTDETSAAPTGLISRQEGVRKCTSANFLTSGATQVDPACPQTVPAAEHLQLVVSRKRGREGEGTKEEVEKRGCEEGMSWWTCLMLGMDQENTRPQVVRKLHTNNTQ